MDPEGKLLMGFRKASSTVIVQDPHLSVIANGSLQSEPILAAAENLPVMSGYSSLLQSLKGNRNSSTNLSAKHLYDGNFGQYVSEKNGSKTLGFQSPQQLLLPERKRNRNIGSKNKRLLIDSQDALDLKISWEELQDMLRPPPNIKLSTMTIEDQEFEEFEEPPVFGKRSIFTIHLSGEEQDQWAQCDNCLKWRRLPADFLLPPRWSCQENIWDQTRCSCSAPDELSYGELENLLKLDKEFKKLRTMTNHKSQLAHHECSQLDAVENAASVGDDMRDSGASSVATTTKHPRHRPGCSCIVCIQPPSGKGKHKPTCTCNVCMTVKRRFKTLMMRKKKRQSEREAEIAQKNQVACGPTEETEVDSSASIPVAPQLNRSNNEQRSGSELIFRWQSVDQRQSDSEIHNGALDLNSCPARDDLHTGSSSRISMMTLLQEATLPLDAYLRQNGLTSLVPEQASSVNTEPQAPGKIEAHVLSDPPLSTDIQEHEMESNELSEPDLSENDQN